MHYTHTLVQYEGWHNSNTFPKIPMFSRNCSWRIQNFLLIPSCFRESSNQDFWTTWELSKRYWNFANLTICDVLVLCIPGPEVDSLEKVRLQASGLISCEWCSVRKLPVLFFQTTQEECQRLRTQLKMTRDKGGLWYDCASNGEDCQLKSEAPLRVATSVVCKIDGWICLFFTTLVNVVPLFWRRLSMTFFC